MKIIAKMGSITLRKNIAIEDKEYLAVCDDNELDADDWTDDMDEARCLMTQKGRRIVNK